MLIKRNTYIKEIMYQLKILREGLNTLSITEERRNYDSDKVINQITLPIT